MTQTPDLEAFLATLEQLPPHEGVVFRGLRGAQPRAVGRAGPRHRDAAVDLARPARRDGELHHGGRLRDPQPRRAAGSSSSRLPVTSTRSSSCRARSSRWSRACRVKDLGVTIVEEFVPAAEPSRPSTSPRSRRRSAARSSRPSCASRCPSPSPASSPATSRDAAGRRRRRPGRPDRGRPPRRCVRRRPRGAVRVRLGATGSRRGAADDRRRPWDYAPGEWSDDTQMAVVMRWPGWPPTAGCETVDALDAIVTGWVDWLAAGEPPMSARRRGQVLGGVAAEEAPGANVGRPRPRRPPASTAAPDGTAGNG